MIWRDKVQAIFHKKRNRDAFSSLRSEMYPMRGLEKRIEIRNFDQPLLWVIIAIVIWGVVMVYSASIAIPNDPRFQGMSNAFFLWRDLAAVALATILSVLAYRVRVAVWEKYARHLFVISLVFLIVVLIPHVGRGVNGSHRWLGIGSFNFQPSEFVKFTMLLYASGYMVRKMDVKKRFSLAVMPMGIALAVVAVLLMLEPDLGAIMVISAIAMGVLFLGGVNMRGLTIAGVTLVGMACAAVFLNPWRRARVLAYLDPWDMDHALGKGYQLSHSLIAFGRGKLFGVGLGRSVEKLNWLPEAHTDFLMAVIGEELGLVGVLVLLLLFLWLIRRVMNIGRTAISLDNVFAGLYAQGVGIWIGFQTFVNIGVTLGVLPTKGLTLPMMSYGGSAMIFNLVALAIVLRIDSENRFKMRKGV